MEEMPIWAEKHVETWEKLHQKVKGREQHKLNKSTKRNLIFKYWNEMNGIDFTNVSEQIELSPWVLTS